MKSSIGAGLSRGNRHIPMLVVVNIWVVLPVKWLDPTWELKETVIVVVLQCVVRQPVRFRAVPCMAQTPTWPLFVLTTFCKLLALKVSLWQNCL